MKPVSLIKMCLSETYSRVRVGKHLSDTFPIKNGLKGADALSPLLSNFALDYVTRRVQVNQDGLKLNSTHRLLVDAVDVNVLGGSVHTMQKNTDTLVVASKEIGLEVNVDRTKCMVISPDQNAGRSHNIEIGNSSFERVEHFKYLETTLTIQNSTEEEIKSRLESGNACYHSVQNTLSSSLFSKKIKIKIHRTVICLLFCMGVKIGHSR